MLSKNPPNKQTNKQTNKKPNNPKTKQNKTHTQKENNNDNKKQQTKNEMMKVKNKTMKKLMFGEHYVTSSLLAFTWTLTHIFQPEFCRAANAFSRLQNIWKSLILQTKTKLKIWKSNMPSLLLYPQKLGEPIRRLRAGSEVSMDIVFEVSWDFSVLPQHATNEEVRRTDI